MPNSSNKQKKIADTSKKISRDSSSLTKVRGLKDVLPEEYKYWQLVNKKLADFSRNYNFQRTELPLLEYQSLYEKAAGKNSSLLNEELALLQTKTSEKVAVRPDVLPGLIRSFLEHGLLNLGGITKSFWLGPVLVYDASQGGRSRQFTQASFDLLGDFGPSGDAQLLLMTYHFFQELQLDVEVQINSVGCSDCRPAYLKQLNEAWKERGKKTKLCNDCKKSLLKNPLAVFACREEACAEVAAELPPMVDCLCDRCRKHFERVLEFLDNLSIPYTLNTKLFELRGYDFWATTVFEIMPLGESRRHMALAAGGNYTGLIETLGGKVNAACGLAIDVEKTISRIRSHNIAVDCGEKIDIFIAQLAESAKQKCMSLFEELRRSGFKVREYFICDSLKGQLEEAEKCKARFTLILGQKELMDDTIILRDMESGVQETIDMRKLANELDRRLNIS